MGNSAQRTGPFYQAGAGIRTEFGMFIPPGSNVFYVRSTGASQQDPPEIAKNINLTLDAALTKCRSGYNDVIFVLPGHTENVSSTFLANLVAGTHIVGVGNPRASNAPKFTWNATTSTMAISVNNVSISRLKLSCDGANGITKAINVTGVGVTIADNYIIWASGAALKSTIGIEVGSGATDCTIRNNYITGTATHNVTDGIKLVGATTPDRCTIADNVIIASATAANGLVHVTVAALNLDISGNRLYNTHTSSTACLAIDAVAADGIICDNRYGVKNDGTAASQGATFGAGALTVCAENYCSDEAKKSGALAPAVVAT